MLNPDYVEPNLSSYLLIKSSVTIRTMADTMFALQTTDHFIQLHAESLRVHKLTNESLEVLFKGLKTLEIQIITN